MKTLTKKLANLNKQYEDISKVKKFITSRKGILLANRLGKERIEDLEKRFEAPKLFIKDNMSKYRIYLQAATTAKVLTKPIKIIDYTKTLERKKKNGELKIPRSLTKEELFEINNPLIRDINGKPIQKTTKKGLLIWNAKTNIPVYKRKSLSTKMELAEKCHRYELHKINKWDVKHPMPNNKQLYSELFPEVAIAAHNTMRNIALENIRTELAKKYCGGIQKDPPLLRLYAAYHKKGYGGKQIAFEQECDPYIYGYTFLHHESYPSQLEMQTRLQKAALHVTDKSITSLKVYDKYGTLRNSIKIAA